MIPHKYDFGFKLQALGVTHVIAYGDDWSKLIAPFKPNSDNPEETFTAHRKGPYGSGVEVILPDAIWYFIRNTPGFEDLAGLRFAPDAETVVGSEPLPYLWWIQAMYAAAPGDARSFYDAFVGPMFARRPDMTAPAPALPSLPPQLAPTPVPAPPPVVAPSAPSMPLPAHAQPPVPDFAQLFQTLQAQILAAIPGIVAAEIAKSMPASTPVPVMKPGRKPGRRG